MVVKLIEMATSQEVVVHINREDVVLIEVVVEVIIKVRDKRMILKIWIMKLLEISKKQQTMITPPNLIEEVEEDHIVVAVVVVPQEEEVEVEIVVATRDQIIHMLEKLNLMKTESR